MNVNIQATKAGGKHYVAVNMDGEMSRHGPFTNKTEAEAMAVRFAATCRTLHAEVVMAAPRLRRSRQWAKS